MTQLNPKQFDSIQKYIYSNILINKVCYQLLWIFHKYSRIQVRNGFTLNLSD